MSLEDLKQRAERQKEELNPCPFCGNRVSKVRHSPTSEDSVSHFCPFIQSEIYLPTVVSWQKAHCWQQLSRSEELNRELVEVLENSIPNDGWEIDKRELLARVKEMGK